MSRTLSRTLSRAAVAVVAIAAMACHDSEDAHVNIQYVSRTGTGVQGFLASLQAGQSTKIFGVGADSTPAPLLELTTPASGYVVVTAVLVDSAGTIGGGATAIALRSGATFAVKVQIDSVDPAKGCTECLGSKPFVLSAAHQRVLADSIWMVWTATEGGKSITK
ncbi:MAG TPA: hypothetical protein VGM82_19695 [Gemmatimonadaceae bacterium]